MYLQRLLQINVVTMAALGTALFGMGQRDATWPLVMFLAAFASVWLNDVAGWVRLPPVAIAVLALAALGYLARETVQSGDVEIPAIGDFLVRLNIVLLFQKKEPRTYGVLLLLSVLQVVVAALFCQGLLFGVLLAVYLFVGLSALTLLCLDRERNRRRGREGQPRAAGKGMLRRLFHALRAARAVVSGMLAGRGVRGLAPEDPARGRGSGAGGSLEPASSPEPPAGSPLPGSSGAGSPSNGRRWPLAGQQAAFTDSAGGYRGQAGVTRELPVRVARMGLGTLVFTSLLFAILPRWGRQPWRGPAVAGGHVVGFTDSPKLGEIVGSPILENPTEVLRIQLFDHATNQHYRVLGDSLYLRGAVLNHYTTVGTRQKQGEWEYRGPRSPRGRQLVEASRPRRLTGLVRQEIVIEPMDDGTLFCVWPFINTRADQVLFFDPARRMLLRHPPNVSRRFHYELLTPAFERGVQTPLVPVAESERVSLDLLRKPPPTTGENAMPGLVEMAHRWVEDDGPDDDHYACARRLERRLRDPRRFHYSLVGQPRDPSIDPIEDFITQHPYGHCEYFATALVLMLRSQGIPARLVVGYKTDEWNRPGHFFQVRQLHAHTWVEAYLEPRHVRGVLQADDPRLKTASGWWLRLDPTPSAPASQTNTVLEAMGSAFNWLDFAWANYVLEMDRPRQHEAIYDPLGDAIAEVGRRVVDPQWWRSVAAGLGRALRNGLRSLAGGRWFSWRGGLAAMLVALVLVLVYRGVRLVLRWLLTRWGRRPQSSARGARAKVAFYSRLEALLARLGLVRSASQTPREFAREAAVKIAVAPGGSHVAPLPGRIVEAFYRVRFGGVPLDNPRARAVEQALKQLEQALRTMRQTEKSKQWAADRG